MKKLILVLVVLIASQNLFAQFKWQWQNPLPTGHKINDCKFVDSNTVIAIADGGGIYKSTDKGVTWVLTARPTQYNLLKIEYVTKNVWYIVGDNGTVLKTMDGGNNWINVSIGGNLSCICISFFNENIGYLIIKDRYIKKTTNGGQNWINISGIDKVLSGIKCFSDTKFLICSNESGSDLFLTINSGVSYNYLPHSGSNTGLQDLFFIDSNTGFAAGNSGVIIKSTDGGLTWNNINSPITDNWVRIKAIDQTTIVALFYDRAYFTTNGGAIWYNFLHSGNLLYGLDVLPNKYTVVVGLQGCVATSPEFVYWTIRSNSVTFDNIYKAQILSDGSIVAATGYSNSQSNYGNILKSTNGFTWSILSSMPSDCVDLQFINLNTGWVAINRFRYSPAPPTPKGYIYKTTNAGVNWTQKLEITGTTNGPVMKRVYFVNENLGYTFYHNTLKTTNGGDNWFDAGWNFNNIGNFHFLNNDSILVINHVGQDDKIYFSSDGGENWSDRTPVNFAADFTDIKFFNNSKGYIGYTNQSPSRNFGVLYTTNCGEDWGIKNISVIGLGGTPNAISLTLVNQSIFVMGESVYYSSNQGTNWIKEVLPTTNIINYFLMKPGSNTEGYLFGYNGTILYSNSLNIPIGIVNTSTNIPEQFLLKQNYPNPFNPSTKINYEIKTPGFVSLKVFDLLGKEVSMLVNEKQNAGSYAVDFNSEEFNLPSGIYFYTLNAGEFKETRKMVLIK